MLIRLRILSQNRAFYSLVCSYWRAHTHTHTHARARTVFILAKSLHRFHTELVYIVSRGEQTVMFVITLGAYKRPNVSFRLEKHFETKLVGHVSIRFI